MIPVYNGPQGELYHAKMEEAIPLLASQGLRFSAIVADPPYCSGGAGREKEQTPGQKYVLTGTKLTRPDFEGDQRDQRSFHSWSVLWLRSLLRVAARPCYLAVFIDRRNLATMVDALQVSGWKFTEILTWDKTQACRPRKGWFRSSQAEFIVVGQVGKRPRDQDYPAGTPCLPGVLTASRKKEEMEAHMHAKPIEVLKWLLTPASLTGGMVLDPFAGLASTLIAASALGLKAVGLEDSEEIAARAAARLVALQP